MRAILRRCDDNILVTYERELGLFNYLCLFFYAEHAFMVTIHMVEGSLFHRKVVLWATIQKVIAR